MKGFWDEFGYDIVKDLSWIFYFILGLFGIEVEENLPEKYW